MTATGLRRTGRRHYRFRHAAHMEWIKLRSLRSTIWTLVITTAGTIGIGVLILASYTPAHFASMTAAQKAAFDPTNMGFIGTIAGMLALGVLGVLTMTSEYSTGMIRATLTAIPNRPLLLAAKTVVFGAVALAAGQAAAFGNFLAGQAALTPAAPHASLGQPQVLRTVVLTGTFLALGLAEK
jgi:ABC-2 type transport system permease protein